VRRRQREEGEREREGVGTWGIGLRRSSAATAECPPSSHATRNVRERGVRVNKLEQARNAPKSKPFGSRRGMFENVLQRLPKALCVWLPTLTPRGTRTFRVA